MGKITTVLLLVMLIPTLSEASAQSDQPSRTIEVHVKRFAFSPSELVLKKGETVDIRLISEDVTHSLSVPQLNISREVSKGHPQDIVFTPQSAGDFQGQCGRFCGSGHGAMKFTVHVTE